MKQFKKITAFFLALIMVMSLSGCQSQTNEKFFKLLENSSSFKEGTINLLVGFSLPASVNKPDKEQAGEETENNFIIRINGDVSLPDAEMDIKLDISVNNQDYIHLTNIVIKDNVFYIDAKTLANSVFNIDEIKSFIVGADNSEEFDTMLSQMISYFGPTGYISINIPEDVADLKNGSTVIDAYKNSEFVKGIMSTCKNSITSFDPPVISKSKDDGFNYNMSLSGEQVENVYNTIMSYVRDNTSLTYDMLYSIFSAMDDATAISAISQIASQAGMTIEPFTTKIDALAFVAGQKEAIITYLDESISKTKTPDTMPTDIVLSVGETKGINRIQLSMKQDDQSIVTSYEFESKDVAITAIENATSIDDVFSAFQSFYLVQGNVKTQQEEELVGNSLDPSSWREEKNIEVNDITDTFIQPEIKSFQESFKKLGYDESTIDYSYGSYVLKAEKADGSQSMEVEFDSSLGDEENHYVYTVSMYKQFNQNQNPNDAAQELTDDANSLLGISLDSQNFVKVYVAAKESTDNNASSSSYDLKGSADIFSFVNGDSGYFLLNYSYD